MIDMDTANNIFSWATIDPKNPYLELSSYRTENEKMLFVLDDGSALVVGGGKSGTIDLPLKKIREQLNQRGKNWSNVVEVVHNHARGERFSSSDYNVNTVLQKLGFTGKFQVYNPRIGSVRMLTRKTK